MSAILPFVKIDSESLLARYFTPYQIAWIEGEDELHAARKQVFALAEKSVRIGWTFCDGFKNVRKRIRFKKRDYLFATRDLPSALEYMNYIYDFADMLGYTRSMLIHDETYLKVKALDPEGNPTSRTEEIKVGYIKFDNGSRIIAFSSNPYAMSVYGGDVGIDEFAKHPNARLLWETAQGRVTWGHDLAIWSSHDGEDSLFNEFVQQARARVVPAIPQPSAPAGHNQNSPLFETYSVADQQTPHKSSSPWNLYFRVTLPDAVDLGLVNAINRTRETDLEPGEFVAGCEARSGSPEIYQQAYLCNPRGNASNHIVDWSVIERCRKDYQIARVHIEHAEIIQRFGEFNPSDAVNRVTQIETFLLSSFGQFVTTKSIYRLGFDVAASGQGDLAVIYIDESKGGELTLRGLFSCRTEDWHFIKTVLFYFMRTLKSLRAAGDETGLGKQICWEVANRFRGIFRSINFSGKKHDLGFALMNQLATTQKRFPSSHQDIAADYFALRKSFHGTRWIFSEARNPINPNSHCDIAWAGALSTHAHVQFRGQIGGVVLNSDGSVTRHVCDY